MKYKVMPAKPEDREYVLEELKWSHNREAVYAGLHYTETNYTMKGVDLLFFVTLNTSKARIDQAVKQAEAVRSVTAVNCLIVPNEWIKESKK